MTPSNYSSPAPKSATPTTKSPTKSSDKPTKCSSSKTSKPSPPISSAEPSKPFKAEDSSFSYSKPWPVSNNFTHWSWTHIKGTALKPSPKFNPDSTNASSSPSAKTPTASSWTTNSTSSPSLNTSTTFSPSIQTTRSIKKPSNNLTPSKKVSPPKKLSANYSPKPKPSTKPKSSWPSSTSSTISPPKPQFHLQLGEVEENQQPLVWGLRLPSDWVSATFSSPPLHRTTSKHYSSSSVSVYKPSTTKTAWTTKESTVHLKTTTSQ